MRTRLDKYVSPAGSDLHVNDASIALSCVYIPLSLYIDKYVDKYVESISLSLSLAERERERALESRAKSKDEHR